MDLRDFKSRILERGYQLDRIVTHASAIGLLLSAIRKITPPKCFWLTGYYVVGRRIGVPIDIDQSDEEVMAEVRRSWEAARNVEMGQPPSPETVQAIRELNSVVASSR